MTAFEIQWEDHTTNQILFGEFDKVADKIRQRRLKQVGQCYPHPEETAFSLVLWNATHGKRKRGRPARTYFQQLEEGTKLKKSDIGAMIGNRADPPRPRCITST